MRKAAEWAKCLLYNHENLSPGPQKPHKGLGMMTHSCNPSTEEDPKAPGQLVLLNWSDPGSLRDLVMQILCLHPGKEPW